MNSDGGLWTGSGCYVYIIWVVERIYRRLWRLQILSKRCLPPRSAAEGAFFDRLGASAPEAPPVSVPGLHAILKDLP